MSMPAGASTANSESAHRPAAPRRLWLRGQPTDLTAFQRAAAALARRIYGRGGSAFYTCPADHLPRLQEIATALHLELEELDAGDWQRGANHDKWRTQAQQTLLDHFTPGQVFTTREAGRLLHTTQPSAVLTSLVQSGKLIRLGYGRTLRYQVAHGPAREPDPLVANPNLDLDPEMS